MIGPRKNPQWTDMVFKSSGTGGWRHFGGCCPGPGSLHLALNFSSVAQKFLPSNVLMGEVKLGFVPANEDAGTMPSPTSTKQNKRLVWWMETSDSNRTSER